MNISFIQYLIKINLFKVGFEVFGLTREGLIDHSGKNILKIKRLNQVFDHYSE